MPMWTALLIIVALACGVSACSSGVGVRAAKAPELRGPLEPLAFLAGSRRELRSNGSLVEETWGSPAGTSMIGCFRWLKPDGSPMVFEMLSITHEPSNDEPGRVFLRLRHYSGTLVAKEDRASPMTLRLDRVGEDGAEFVAYQHCADVARIVYQRRPGGAVGARVEFSEQAGRPALVFEFAPA